MAHGAPDWGGTAPTTTIASVQDMGELAARMKSIVTFDRRGNVIYADDFEHGIGRYLTSEGGTGAAVTLSNALAKQGQWSVHLHPGLDAPETASLGMSLAILGPTRIGFEHSFYVTGDANELLWYVYYYTGSNLYWFGVRYVFSTQVFSYLGSDANWHAFTSAIPLYTSDQLFHTMKIVVDVSNVKYVRFIFDSTEYDLSAHSAVSGSASDAAHFSAYLNFYGNAGTSSDCYVDNWIITINEP